MKFKLNVIFVTRCGARDLGCSKECSKEHQEQKEQPRNNGLEHPRPVAAQGRNKGNTYPPCRSRNKHGQGLGGWQEQAKEAQAEARRESRTTGEQRDVLGLLEGRQGDWLTCREVVEELGLEWGTTGAGKDANRVRDALKRLAADQRIQATRAGTAYVYSSIWPGHYEPQKPQIPQKPVIEMDLGSESKPQKPQKPQKPFISAPSSDGRTLPSEVSEIEPQKPNPLQRNASEPSEVSEAMWIGGVMAGASRHREATTEGSAM